MRREASRGKNRGLFREACHPKSPPIRAHTHTHCITHSFIISSLLLLLLLSCFPLSVASLFSLILWLSFDRFHRGLFFFFSPFNLTPPPLFYAASFIPLNFCSFRFPLLSIKLFFVLFCCFFFSLTSTCFVIFESSR